MKTIIFLCLAAAGRLCAGAPAHLDNPFFVFEDGLGKNPPEKEAEIAKRIGFDGISFDDAKLDPKAKRYDCISHQEALEKDLRVMDGAAFALARENRMPIIVFSIADKGAIEAVLRGKGRATVVG